MALCESKHSSSLILSTTSGSLDRARLLPLRRFCLVRSAGSGGNMDSSEGSKRLSVLRQVTEKVGGFRSVSVKRYSSDSRSVVGEHGGIVVSSGRETLLGFESDAADVIVVVVVVVVVAVVARR